MAEKIKVLLIEDHAMVRMGLQVCLSQSDKVELIGEAEDGLKGINMAKRLVPDVILMDIGLPYVDGIEATRRLKEEHLNSKILIFTSRDSEDDIFSAFKAGADGYIMKGASQEQTISAICAVNDGVAWLDPNIAKLVLGSIQKTTTPEESKNMAKNLYGLTERELEVLSLIVEGLTNPEIADRLIISRATAKTHVHSILQKLCITDRTKAAVFAMKEGLV